MASKIRVPALERALNILEVLQKHHRCTISELISITGLPRSSVYVLVDDMVKLRLLRQNSDKTVQLWMKLVSLGNSASDSLDLKEMISPYLDKLISSVDCLAVHFGIMDDDKAYYVLKRTSSKSGIRILSREGAEVSLVHSALGKCASRKTCNNPGLHSCYSELYNNSRGSTQGTGSNQKSRICF